MSFLWHDYETFGTHPALDRPAQFAAIRTDDHLEEVDDPVMLYCKPHRDYLPHPMACLVTGITPQEADEKGLPEPEFARRIQQLMMENGTCTVGYNSVRFDDEFSRNLFYRNLLDPYQREWGQGRSRWDLIDVMRHCYALRPDGINWPERESGVPSFRLEDLTAANNIEQSGAHDALVDVRATINLARLLRKAQPRLFDYAFQMRQSPAVLKVLNLGDPKPVVYTTSLVPAERGCTTLVLPICTVPDRPKSVVAFDLASDPTVLIELSAEEIRQRVFSPTSELPEGSERIPLFTIASNKVPLVSPASVLGEENPKRLSLDKAQCYEHAQLLLSQLAEVKVKIMEAFAPAEFAQSSDPDVMIYDGFFSPADKSTMKKLVETPAEKIPDSEWHFQDQRLPEMVFRYRARNYPQSLDPAEIARWEEHCAQRLHAPELPGQLSLDAFDAEVTRARQSHAGAPDKLSVLDQLEAWVDDLAT